MDELPKDPTSLPSYYFQTPSTDPDPELLALLPEKSLFEQVVDFGLYFVAAFQIICFLAVIFLSDPDENTADEDQAKEKSEIPKKLKKRELKKEK